MQVRVIEKRNMKLLESVKQIIDKDKNNENLLKSESVEVALMHCNVVKSDYQQASKVMFSFVPNKQFGQLVNISPHPMIMLNTINTELSFIDVCFTEQSSKSVEIEYNVSMIFVVR